MPAAHSPPVHAPPDYRCPFCGIARGLEDPRTRVWEDDVAIGVLSLHQQASTAGALLVFPRQHIENIYKLPDAVGAHLFSVTRRLAVALRAALDCEGITIRQNNEPAGGQDVWHYHAHIVPRHHGDGAATAPHAVMPVEDRADIAARVRAALERDPR